MCAYATISQKIPWREFAVSYGLEMCVPDNCEAAHIIRF